MQSNIIIFAFFVWIIICFFEVFLKTFLLIICSILQRIFSLLTWFIINKQLLKMYSIGMICRGSISTLPLYSTCMLISQWYCLWPNESDMINVQSHEVFFSWLYTNVYIQFSFVYLTSVKPNELSFIHIARPKPTTPKGPAPNVKNVTSKIGSLQNTSYTPGGGQVGLGLKEVGTKWGWGKG